MSSAKNYHLLKFYFLNKKINFPISIIIIVAVIIIVFFIIPKEYTSRVSILPPAANFSQSFVSQLGTIGKMAGLDLGSVAGQSQEMYMGIIQSRFLQTQILEYEYEFKVLNEQSLVKSSLLDFFKIDVESDREKFEKAFKKMRDDVITVNIDADNDILFLEVTTENPFLSAEVANQIINTLNKIVNTLVQKEFRQKYSYLNTRLGEIQDSLKIAEVDFRIFLEKITDPTTPEFQINNLRYKRNLQIQTELLIEYRKQKEMFLADNMINLSEIKILDHAVPPYRKSRPKRILLSLSLITLLLFVQLGINASWLIYRNFKTEVFGKNLEKPIS